MRMSEIFEQITGEIPSQGPGGQSGSPALPTSPTAQTTTPTTQATTATSGAATADAGTMGNPAITKANLDSIKPLIGGNFDSTELAKALSQPNPTSAGTTSPAAKTGLNAMLPAIGQILSNPATSASLKQALTTLASQKKL